MEDYSPVVVVVVVVVVMMVLEEDNRVSVRSNGKINFVMHWRQPCGQSYKDFSIVNCDSSLVI